MIEMGSLFYGMKNLHCFRSSLLGDPTSTSPYSNATLRNCLEVTSDSVASHCVRSYLATQEACRSVDLESGT